MLGFTCIVLLALNGYLLAMYLLERGDNKHLTEELQLCRDAGVKLRSRLNNLINKHGRSHGLG